VKRIVDIVVSLLALIILSPLIILIALLIKYDSKGCVIFKQERVGQFGKAFSLYKFRSMIAGSESVGPYYTRDGDPRITPVGKIVRKTSLDELPQLINVLRGDMSLVGPRPDVPKQRANYTESDWNKRNLVRPGITGLAQARLRSNASLDERTRLDLEYVENVSLGYDFWIIIMTVRQVLLKGGN